MLVDQNYPDVLPFCCEPFKCGFDRCVVRLAIDYKEILLRVWSRCDMLGRVSLGLILLMGDKQWQETYANAGEK